jgi:hypothetical protein
MAMQYDVGSIRTEIQYIVGRLLPDQTVSQDEFITIDVFDAESDIIVFDTTTIREARVTTQSNLIIADKVPQYTMTVNHVHNKDSRLLQTYFLKLGYSINSMTIVNKNTTNGERTTYYNGACLEVTKASFGSAGIANDVFKYTFTKMITSSL